MSIHLLSETAHPHHGHSGAGAYPASCQVDGSNIFSGFVAPRAQSFACSKPSHKPQVACHSCNSNSQRKALKEINITRQSEALKLKDEGFRHHKRCNVKGRVPE